jgi:hypothetical protein
VVTLTKKPHTATLRSAGGLAASQQLSTAPLCLDKVRDIIAVA